jgi:alpha-beta hydrolase superfamily lysophospholipase
LEYNLFYVISKEIHRYYFFRKRRVIKYFWRSKNNQLIVWHTKRFNFNIYNTEFWSGLGNRNTSLVVVLVHRSGKTYGLAHVTKNWQKIGILAVTFDHFGHGKLRRKRGHCLVLSCFKLYPQKQKKPKLKTIFL